MGDDTAVNSDFEDLSNIPKNDSIALKIVTHEKYQYYQRKHSEFASNHNLNIDQLVKHHHRHNLTGETLYGSGKIGFRSPSLFFIKDSSTEDEVVGDSSITFFHLGHKLSGHNQIVHGGLIATLLDEVTCLLAFEKFAAKTGVTANLNVSYKKPTYVDNYILLKCEIIKREGRKCWVSGKVYLVDLQDDGIIERHENLLSHCEVLVIEPKWAAELHARNQTPPKTS